MSDDDTRSFEDVRDEVTSDSHGEAQRHSENVDTGRKHTTGTIDGYGFSLRVDGDAPAGLVADIESALAGVKQERENGEVDIQEYAESVNAINISGERLMNGKLRYEIEVPTLKQDISHYPDGFELEEIGDKCIELIEV